MANSKKPETVEEIAENEAKEILAHNMRFYNAGCEVPKNALKEIRAGRLKGMSDVNPMWRMKRMTEIFGPCGIGWKYTIDKQWTESYNDEVKCFCNISLYFYDKERDRWSEAIPGSGGSAVVTKEKSGFYVSDEAYKMALTDALSIAMKPLGIGATVWYGDKATGHNESKYEQYTNQLTPEAIIKEAIGRLENCKTRSDVAALWNELAYRHPEICAEGGEFYTAVGKKLGEVA